MGIALIFLTQHRVSDFLKEDPKWARGSLMVVPSPEYSRKWKCEPWRGRPYLCKPGHGMHALGVNKIMSRIV